MSIRQGCMHLCDKIKLHICSLSALLVVKLSNHPPCLRCHRWFLLRSFSWAFLIVITRMAAHFLSLKINTKSQEYRFIYDSLLLLLSCVVQGFYNKALHSYSCSKVPSVYETWVFFVPMINSDEVLQSIQMPWSEIGKIFAGYVPYSHMVVTVFFFTKVIAIISCAFVAHNIPCFTTCTLCLMHNIYYLSFYIKSETKEWCIVSFFMSIWK